MLGSWWGTAVAQVDVQLTAEERFHPFVTEKNSAGYSHLSGNLKDVRGKKKKPKRSTCPASTNQTATAGAQGGQV